MNNFQRIILFAGLLTVAGFCLRPPYQWEQETYLVSSENDMSRHAGTQIVKIGHQWIWNPPQGWTVEYVGERIVHVARIDWARLGIYVGLTIAACAFTAFVGFGHKKHEPKEKPMPATESNNVTESPRFDKMRCPTCGLISPDSALRCDCGYDFQSGKMERPYHDAKTPMPAWIVMVLAVQGVVSFFAILGKEEGRITLNFFPLLLWASIAALLYFLLAKGKNGARIALAIWAFPIGLLFLLSSDLKSFIRERNNPHRPIGD